MERDDAITKLRAHEAELRQLGVEHLYLFGSTKRARIPTSICSSIIPRDRSGFTS
jgi:hypothetical protein